MARSLKGGIRRKVIGVIFISTSIMIALGIILVYLLGFNTMRRDIGSQYVRLARLMGTYVTEVCDGEIEDIKTYAVRPLWIDFIKEANKTHEGLSGPAVEKRMESMDKNRVSVSMKDILQLRKNISELLITDKFGGLVAASGKTSDFYQADEEWWQEAYDNGRGTIFVGDVEYDESSKDWSIPMAVSMKDEDNSVIGICKQVVALERLFKPLKDFKIGETGHAELLDQNFNILFHAGISAMTAKFSGKEDIKKLFNEQSGYFILTDPYPHKEKQLIAYVKVRPHFYFTKDIYWIVLVSQNVSEAFQPLTVFMINMSISTILLLVIMVPVGHILGGAFAKPIHELHVATERVIAGDWDYKVEARTGDEIEQFADTFKIMISKIKSEQENLVSAKKALEELSGSLEKKVEERTAELNRTNEATLNILEDLTFAKDKLDKYTKELEEALRIKSDFTSTVSHELRTPLAAVKEGIALVTDGTAGPLTVEQKEFLDIAKRNVDRLARLINNILDFQKLEAGKMPMEIREHNINEAVEETFKTMASLADDKRLRLVLDLGEKLPVINFDKDKIIQVLTNLVGNAIKNTDKGGITIMTKRGENFIEVSVKDTGAGIKKEDMPRLFQQFTQIETPGERKTGGTGLGLAISKELIKAHHGKIYAESEFGVGSVFAFRLPIVERRV